MPFMLKLDSFNLTRESVMEFVASFIVFLLFVLALSMSMLIKRRPMMTEEEATASIMEGGACTTCQQLCSMAGKKVEKRKPDCAIKNMEIPHQSV